MPAPTLDVFLLARLDEDDQTARDAAEEVGDGHWQQRNVRVVTVADRDREIADYAIVECIDHIVRHDPARVLREVEAKRRILDAYVDAIRMHGLMEETNDDGKWDWLFRSEALENVVRLLALPHSDHPDYREEWKP